MLFSRVQIHESKIGPRYDRATLLPRVQLQLAEIARAIASTKAEVLGSCVTSCNWVSRGLPILGNIHALCYLAGAS